MVDSLEKCENYRDARGARMGGGWHKIEPAQPGATVWRQKSATRGGNSPVRVMRVDKKGNTFGATGYIDKNGFNQHT